MPEYVVKGLWVIVAFEETLNPGLVRDINQEKILLQLNSCIRVAIFFRWPAKEDRIDVERKS